MKTKKLFTSLGLILLLIALSTVAIRYLTRSETLSEYAASREDAVTSKLPAGSAQTLPKSDTSQDGAPIGADTKALTTADSGVDYSDADAFFTISPLSDEIKARITGASYPQDASDLAISYDELRYLTVLFCDFEGETNEGELICNEAIADDLIAIFRELYENGYPIERMTLIDDYGADDEASMQDNNTSCFNYRTVAGSSYLSNHALGLAIDVNPFYNPYVLSGKGADGEDYIAPHGAERYADRTLSFEHKIDRNDLCYRLFITRGFTWGGSWTGKVQDYQHFEKVP